MKLNELSDNPGATKKRMRVGRGIGSGKGKTCGRGHKGQKSRTGVAVKGFEGGQMPIYRRLPKRGFTSRNKQEYNLVNLGRLQRSIDEGKLDVTQEIHAETLKRAGLIRDNAHPVKLLGQGELKSPVKIAVDKASKAARDAVEKAGGTVTLAA